LWDTFGSDNYVPPVDPTKRDNWEDLKSPAHWEESKMKDGSKEGSPLLGHLTRVFNPDSLTSLLQNEEGFRINEFEVDSQGYLVDNDSDSSLGGGDHVHSSSSEHEQDESLSNFWNNSYWGDNSGNGPINVDTSLFGPLMSNGNGEGGSPSLSLEEAISVLTPTQQGEEDFDSQQQSSPVSTLGDTDPSTLAASSSSIGGIEDNINHLDLNQSNGNLQLNGVSPHSSLDLSSGGSAASSTPSSALPTPTSPTPSSPFFSSSSSPEQDSLLDDTKDGLDAIKPMLYQLLLTRDTVGRWLEDPFFDRLVRGCFVRALVGSTLRSNSPGNSSPSAASNSNPGGMHTPVYRIARIVEVQNNCYPSYSLEPHHNLHPTRKGIMLQMGNTLRMVSLQAISNKLPSEQEYYEWREETEKTHGTAALSVEEVQEKSEIFRLLDMKYPSIANRYGMGSSADAMNKMNASQPSPELESYPF
jgi:hypothetical protein